MTHDQLKVGMRVRSMTGQSRTVLDVSPQSFSLTLDDGRSVRLPSRHALSYEPIPEPAEIAEATYEAFAPKEIKEGSAEP